MHKERRSGLLPWSHRLAAAPPHLEEIVKIWHFSVIEYWKQMKSVLQKNPIRNVMDMNSNPGVSATALNDKDVWVMNVVASAKMSARLKVFYERGLIGTVNDWYALTFSTYTSLTSPSSSA
ncbi:hypothetical protein DITRI_Ditri09bG0019700 [Diplodiscus trichospermus]